jgi:hypothetical protein
MAFDNTVFEAFASYNGGGGFLTLLLVVIALAAILVAGVVVTWARSVLLARRVLLSSSEKDLIEGWIREEEDEVVTPEVAATFSSEEQAVWEGLLDGATEEQAWLLDAIQATLEGLDELFVRILAPAPWSPSQARRKARLAEIRRQYVAVG